MCKIRNMLAFTVHQTIKDCEDGVSIETKQKVGLYIVKLKKI